MAMVEKIYEGAGLELTKEARNEMGKYLAHNAEERKKVCFIDNYCFKS